MTEGKLILRNVRKNIEDYLIYFLTLMISVSMFYAFNSIQSQPAFRDLDATKQLLSDQLGIYTLLGMEKRKISRILDRKSVV